MSWLINNRISWLIWVSWHAKRKSLLTVEWVGKQRLRAD